MTPIADAPGAVRPAEPELSAERLAVLFRAVAAGQLDALDEIYTLLSGAVFGVALWRTGSVEDASDVVQETFLRLAGRRDRLAAVKDPRTWLLAVACHAAADLARRRRRRDAEPLEDVLFLAAPAEDAARAVEARRASALLGGLPPAQREAIYLKHFLGLTFAEIGEAAGVPTFTAASRYRLGLARLRRLMEGGR
jgi:RNA polymerase sigma-70 factor (ECF subfamily)